MGGSSSVISHLENPANLSVKLISFEHFKTLGKLPRYPDDKGFAIALGNLTIEQYKDSLIVFISHRWLRSGSESDGWGGKPDPDNVKGSKYLLCVKGIELLCKQYAEGMSGCYIWIDCGCVDQNSDPATDLKLMDEIMMLSDCVFTPIVDENYQNDWIMPSASSTRKFFDEYRSSGWTGGRSAYLSRAWCRLEMLYAQHIPLMEEDIHDTRMRKMSGDLLLAKKMGRRPHILFSSYSFVTDMNPLFLPAYTDTDPWFDIQCGQITHDSDRVVITKLVEDLKVHMKRRGEESYRGECNTEGQRHGKGKFVFSNGDSYEGQWKNNLMHGRGKYITVEGDIYEGEFVDNHREGKGILINVDLGVYEGDFHQNQKSGKGKYCFYKGDRYEGDYAEDVMHGLGVFISATGECYNGEFRNGFMEGKGKFSYASGDCYEGNWKNNTKHGIGVFRSIGGDYYDGEWFEGKMHGNGKYFTSHGDLLYDGKWDNGDIAVSSTD